MKEKQLQTLYYSLIITIIAGCWATRAAAQEIVPVPYGDMDRWLVRQIKESAIIGGNTKLLYELAPVDTLTGNDAYTNRGGSPWGCSNVLAKVAGVVKTNTSVFPERRGDGWCARLETRIETVKVFGLIDMEVLAAGSIHLGAMLEPIRGTRNPQSKLMSGIPFTSRPKAIRFDYKVRIAPEERIKSTGFGSQETIGGKDEAVVNLFLQKRWEDADGNLYATRVGTLVVKYTASSDGWIEGATYPILYGDITGKPEYKDYMKIQAEERYALNSRGENVPIRETGWAAGGEAPTHVVLQFASSHGGAYIGSPGNTLWIDNVVWIY